MTPGPVRGLDEPCSVCERTSGDHTLREWAACLGQPTTNLPYEAVPDDLAQAAAASVRDRFGLDPNVIVADHVNLIAATLDGSSALSPVQVKIPLLLHEFQVGVAGHPPVEVAKVAFIGSSEAVRGYGRLARDTANGAANAAERV